MNNPFLNLWHWLFPEIMDLQIFMRSGNVISIDRVTEYDIRNDGPRVVYLAVVQLRPARKLLVGTIDLSQIEAVVKSA